MSMLLARFVSDIALTMTSGDCISGQCNHDEQEARWLSSLMLANGIRDGW